jgi:hypothetical protein
MRTEAADQEPMTDATRSMPKSQQPMIRSSGGGMDDDVHRGVSLLPFAASAPFAKPSSEGTGDVIHKEDYFQRDTRRKPPPVPKPDAPKKDLWHPTQLRPVPAYYPLEKSTRLVEFDSPEEIAVRLTERLRTLSVYAVYDDKTATASLLTPENVEMFLSLWHTPSHSSQQGVLVEVQRRKGDSIAFHRYCRAILDAAVEGLPHDVRHVHSVEDNIVYSKKVERLLSMELGNQKNQEHENAIVAIEIAHGLLMKDRMDARQLGLESLCLLSDPTKTGYLTATLTAHVVLLGSTQGVEIPGVETEDYGVMMNEGPFQEIRETILGLVQFSRIGEDEPMEEDPMEKDSIDKEHMTLLHNLALAVLANSLDVIEQNDRFEDDTDEPEDTKPRARLRTASSNDVADEFMAHTKDISSKEILSTLISELGSAQHKPHNATLSAKCIGSLCRASEKAKRRAKELGAKQVVSTALDVGERTHLKLETECKKVVTALEAPSTERLDDEGIDELL